MKKFLILVSLCVLETISLASSSNLIDSSGIILNEDGSMAAEDVQNLLECITKAKVEKGPDFTTNDVLECAHEWSAEDGVTGVNGETDFINFVISARGRTQSFVTGNSSLAWGKWVRNNKIVPNVNNLPISNRTAALFQASGRKFSPSGCEGSFLILKKRLAIANVTFDIPTISSNALKIKHYNKNYRCTTTGFSRYGSPTVKISCGLASRIGTEENDVKISVVDRMASRIFHAGKYYRVLPPRMDERNEFTEKSSSVFW